MLVVLHQDPHPFWANSSPRLEDVILVKWKGVLIARIKACNWSQTCSMGFISVLRGDQSMTPHPVVPEKKSGVTCCVGRGIVLDIISPKNACRSGRHTISEKPDIALAVKGLIQQHLFTIPTGATVIVHGLDACISVCPLAFDAREHDHHCETAWRETHHRWYNTSNVWGPIHCCVVCDPKSIWDTWRDV